MKKTDKSAAPLHPSLLLFVVVVVVPSPRLSLSVHSLYVTKALFKSKAEPTTSSWDRPTNLEWTNHVLFFFRENNLLFVIYLTNKHGYRKEHIFVKKIGVRGFKIRCLISLEHVTRVVEAFALLRHTRRMDGRKRGEPIGEHWYRHTTYIHRDQLMHMHVLFVRPAAA